MPLCYNQDTTTNWHGGSISDGAVTENTTTAEGSQNEGKYIRVENPATANLLWFAGAVTKGGWVGKTGPRALDIYVPNGAIVPLRTDKDCTIGDSIGVEDGEVVFTPVTGDGSPVPCAQVMETINRSSANGLVLAKLFDTGQQITATSAHFAPVRGKTGGRVYGLTIDGENFFVGTAAAQSYLVYIQGDKVTASTGDAYGGLLFMQANIEGANDSNYIFRGLNLSIDLEDSADLGSLYGANISISLKANTANIGNAVALQIDAQDLSSGTKDVFGGADIALNREGTAATEEFGLRLRTRGTINTAVNTVFRVDKDATDHGFVNLFNIESDAVDYVACQGDITVTTDDKAIPIVLAGTTYYLTATDGIPGA
jgi:hypothetical protein